MGPRYGHFSDFDLYNGAKYLVIFSKNDKILESLPDSYLIRRRITRAFRICLPFLPTPTHSRDIWVLRSKIVQNWLALTLELLETEIEIEKSGNATSETHS